MLSDRSDLFHALFPGESPDPVHKISGSVARTNPKYPSPSVSLLSFTKNRCIPSASSIYSDSIPFVVSLKSARSGFSNGSVAFVRYHLTSTNLVKRNYLWLITSRFST